MKILRLLLVSLLVGLSAILINAETSLPIVRLLGKSFYYYEAKKGESLAGIAKRFDWDLSILDKTNSDVITPLDNGTLLYYPVPKKKKGEEIEVKQIDDLSSEKDEHVSEEAVKNIADSAHNNLNKTGEEDIAVNSLRQYKVRRGDSWMSIAENEGIDQNLLIEANPGIKELKRGEIIYIPHVEEVEDGIINDVSGDQISEVGEKSDYYIDENLSEGSSQDNLNNLEVSVAIILSDVNSNRDMEFSRGALLAISRMKSEPYHTRLTIINGSEDKDNVLNSLESFSPTIIIATADKEFPDYLTQYSKEENITLVNTFDVRDENYIENPNMIQFLTPSSYFNEGIAGYITSNYPAYNLIIAGNMESSDVMGEGIVKGIVRNNSTEISEIPLEDLPEMELEPSSSYLIYATPSKRDDVMDLLEKVTVMRQRNPLAEVRVIGRPNWITFSDSQRELFEDNNVLMPTRFYFDANESRSKSYIEDYKNMFGHTPLKSYPVYSATAYDIMTSLIPNIANNNGDCNAEFAAGEMLQSDIRLQRLSNLSGMINQSVYLIDFSISGNAEKILIP